MASIYDLLGLSEFQQLNQSLPIDTIINNIEDPQLLHLMESSVSNIESIYIQHTLQMNNSEDLVVLEIHLKEPVFLDDIARILQKAIPYGIVFVFVSSEKYLIMQRYAPNAGCPRSDDDLHISSGWIYEEMLDDDFMLEFAPNLTGSSFLKNTYDKFTCMQVQYLIDTFISNSVAFYSPYICLRELIDILRMQEERRGQQFLMPILKKLYDNGALFQLGYSIYADYQACEDNFKYWTGGMWTMEDRRYNATRRYEGISSKLLCQYNEDFDLYAIIQSESWGYDSLDSYDDDIEPETDYDDGPYCYPIPF